MIELFVAVTTPVSVEIWENNYRNLGENVVKDTWQRQAKTCANTESDNLN